MNSTTIAVAARFHSLADTAMRNGGFWISAGGGTANVAAGVIARTTGASFEDALAALRETGGADWYQELAYAQPWDWCAYFDADPGRFDVRTVARAACKVAQT